MRNCQLQWFPSRGLGQMGDERENMNYLFCIPLSTFSIPFCVGKYAFKNYIKIPCTCKTPDRSSSDHALGHTFSTLAPKVF